MSETFFYRDVARAHFAGGNFPRASNIYMNEMCRVCEEYLDDEVTIIRAKSNTSNAVICEKCAYSIHCAYERQF